MGEQRGIYESVVIKENGEFVAKKAAWLTPKVQDEAYGVMRIMDDLSGVIAKGEAKGNEEAVLEAQKAIAQATKGISKEAKTLISAWRSYSDHLYSEHVKMQIPRIFNKAGLTRNGQAMVDQVMSGPNGLNYEIDRLFSSIAETNPTEKITGMKNVLDGLKKRLEFIASACGNVKKATVDVVGDPMSSDKYYGIIKLTLTNYDQQREVLLENAEKQIFNYNEGLKRTRLLPRAA